MEYVGTVKAAFLLKICPQRVRQLLAEGRIKGAFKKGRFWQIPLYNRVPKVIAGKRGPKGKWSKQRQRSLTRIHVNGNNIKNNIGSEHIEPVVIVRQGSKTFYCHQIDICGPSRIAYSPHKSLTGGAKVWIEVEPETVILPQTLLVDENNDIVHSLGLKMSVILSLITALVAFLIAFQNSGLGEDVHRKKVKTIALLIGCLAVFSSIYNILFRFLVILPAGEVGVVEIFGNVQDTPLNSGIHWVSPLAKVTKFSTRLQDIKETVDATSKEGLNLKLDVSLQYKINPQQASTVYKTIGIEEEEILIPRFRSMIRQITASYDAKDIYGEKRGIVADKLRNELNQSLEPLGFIVDESLLRNVILPQTIQKAIEEKLEAQQASQKQQFINEKERQAIAFELEKAQQEATRQKIEAQGVADSQRLLSQGLTEQLIKLKAIEATQKLAGSENSKVIIIGGGEDKLPLLLQSP